MDSTSFGQRLALSFAGGVLLAMPAALVWEDGKKTVGAYVLGSAAGAAAAGRAREGGNFGGAILGAGIGAMPMLLELADRDTGEFGDSELLWVPLISFTIPIGAALGHRYLSIL